MTAAILTLLLAALAGADPDVPEAANSAGLEAIVVTARRRTESSQDVPISMTVLSGDGLWEQHITSNQDLEAQVPSLTISSNGQTRSTQTLIIRGEGASFLGAQGVVMYVADTPLPSGVVYSTQGDPGQFLDLTNIQVLKGPQGTLFGRNATGGAVLLEPTRPDVDFGGYLQGQTGNYDDRELEGVINVPLVDDKLIVRGAYRIVQRDGFTQNLVGPADDNENYWTGRIGIDFKATDRIDNYLLAYDTDQRNRGPGLVIGAVNPAFGFGYLQPLVDAQNARGPRLIEDPTNSHDILLTVGVIDTLTIRLDDALSLTNIASYSTLKHSQRYDYDGLGILPIITEIAWDTNDVHQYQDNIRQYTEEPQLQGLTLAHRLQWTAGAYVERSEPNGPNQAESTGIGLGVLQENQQYGTTHDSAAVYAQAGYDTGGIAAALENLTLTAGLRQTWDVTKGFQDISIIYPSAPSVQHCNADPALAPPECGLSARITSNAPSWLLGLDYKIDPDLMVYANEREGYKTGGFNTNAVNPSNLTYKPEYVLTSEAGLKSSLTMGGAALQVNADAYLSDYTDIQRAGADNNPAVGSFGARTVNAAAARVSGFEGEFVLQPSKRWTLSGNYAYTDARYKQYDLPALAQTDCSGKLVGSLVPGSRPTADLSCIPFAYTVRNQFALGLKFVIFDAAPSGLLTFGAHYRYQTRQYTGWTVVPGSEPGLYLSPFGLLDLSLDWHAIAGSKVDAQLFATNALDKTYRIGNSGVYNAIGFQTSLYGEPRMFGAQLRYRFGGVKRP